MGRISRFRARRELRLPAHRQCSRGGVDVRRPCLEVRAAGDLLVPALQGGADHLLALERALGRAGEARAARLVLAPLLAPLGARQGPFLVAQIAQALAQALQVIERRVVEYGMVAGEYRLLLLV